MKTCVKCGLEKEFSAFAKCSKHKDGLQHHCKVCNKEYRERNKDKLQSYMKNYYLENEDTLKQKAREYPKDKKAEIDKRRFINNPGLRAFKSSVERAIKRQALPKWLTEDQKQQIKQFYWLSQDLKCVTGEEYHVDHIIPLRGENICGLHVPWNLQVLPADVNIAKSNTL